MINVTGPCFPENAKIECQFQDMSGGKFPAIYRDRNHASCYMPPVFFHGYVDLTVTINNGDALFYGRFYIRKCCWVEDSVPACSKRSITLELYIVLIPRPLRLQSRLSCHTWT